MKRRAIALVAAYAIALAGLLAAFTSARAAGDNTSAPIGVICHNDLSGQSGSSGGHDDGQVCANNCCIGCMLLTAALPPPPVTVKGALQSAGRALPRPRIYGLVASPLTQFHRSRAPPLSA